jgi:hypothetical protein
MKRLLILHLLLLAVLPQLVLAIQPPSGVISVAGDQSVVLHWDRSTDASLGGYRVYRSTTGVGGPFSLLNSSVLTGPGYCDLSSKVVNGQTNFYYVTAVDTNQQESLPSTTLGASPHAFASDDEFLDYVQQTCFDYFWYSASPANGLVPDRTASGSSCSIAAVGFGLTAIGIAVDHGWIARTQAVARVSTTLDTFLQGPQGPDTTGVIGYKGWFYHFLDMNTAARSGAELSSIDTALLLAGILYARQYFDAPSADEMAIRSKANAIFNQVDWTFMSQGTNAVAMGWLPTTGFANFNNWIGYNEAMILYCFGLGAATNPLPPSAWSRWTSGYVWLTNYGQAYLHFPPMFVHQYSHCWIDFRHLADAYMTSHNCTYFENSRRATLAQVAYAAANPSHQVGYGTNVWGLTACDGPTGYTVHGVPPDGSDDGTIAPTAAGGSMPFAPEYVVPTLRYFYSHYRPRIWTEYGFRDAFNLGAGWYDSDELGIDQGPIVIMIENYRTQRVWRLFMQCPEVRRGLQRAGFVSLPSMSLNLQPVPALGAFDLSWDATASRSYQVEYSPQLLTWSASPGFVLATNSGIFNWLDSGPPLTVIPPATAPQRFYRVFQLGPP